MSSKVLLFVYGTLKRMGPNHHLIQSEKFLRKCQTEPHYRLYNYQGLPCLTRFRPGTVLRGRSIKGELYEVDKDLMPFIDRFEGGGYFKAPIEIKDVEGIDGVIYAYFYQAYLPTLDPQQCQDCGSEYTFEMEGV